MKLSRIAIAFTLSIAINLTGCDWFGEGLRQVSVGNVKEQWQFAYECDENLKSAARKVCSARQAVDNEPDKEAKEQLRSYASTYELNYASIQADCEAGYRNAFENKYIRPYDVPNHAADLNESLENVGCKK
jgi:hypothetical protein